MIFFPAEVLSLLRLPNSLSLKVDHSNAVHKVILIGFVAHNMPTHITCVSQVLSDSPNQKQTRQMTHFIDREAETMKLSAPELSSRQWWH